MTITVTYWFLACLALESYSPEKETVYTIIVMMTNINWKQILNSFWAEIPFYMVIMSVHFSVTSTVTQGQRKEINSLHRVQGVDRHQWGYFTSSNFVSTLPGERKFVSKMLIPQPSFGQEIKHNWLKELCSEKSLEKKCITNHASTSCYSQKFCPKYTIYRRSLYKKT